MSNLIPDFGAFHASAKPSKFFLQPIITAIDVINTMDFGNAFCGKPREDKAGTRSEIGCHDRRCLKLFDAFHEYVVALDLEIGSHAVKLRHVHETVFKDILCDHRGSLGEAHERHELSLKICGKTRVGGSGDVDRKDFFC